MAHLPGTTDFCLFPHVDNGTKAVVWNVPVDEYKALISVSGKKVRTQKVTYRIGLDKKGVLLLEQVPPVFTRSERALMYLTMPFGNKD